MDDLRKLLFDGRFCVPFSEKFKFASFGEGGMSHEEVKTWILNKQLQYRHWVSTDYSKFDTSQADWLIEDAFTVIKSCFKRFNDVDEALWNAMVYSYVHKDVLTHLGELHFDKGNISGSCWTYIINTVINRICIGYSMKAQGVQDGKWATLICGDDSLLLYNDEKFSLRTHCSLIQKYFGITTSVEKSTDETKFDYPEFLSRCWDPAGAKRPIQDVVWNMMFPERYRDYRKSGVPMRRAVALLLLCGVFEQPGTMREWFDIGAIMRDAEYDSRSNNYATYEILRKMGSGFATSWIHFKTALNSARYA